MSTVIYSIPDDADYYRVRELVGLRIADDRRKGGDAATLSRAHERWLDEHDTAEERRGAPCQSCGHPWPCGVIRGIVEVQP